MWHRRVSLAPFTQEGDSRSAAAAIAATPAMRCGVLLHALHSNPAILYVRTASKECSAVPFAGRVETGQVSRIAVCYVLGLTQGAFFIFHLLTKPFPSRDQPPIHLDHMTNHLTSHLTTHLTSHMPFQSPAPQRHPFYVTCSQVTYASPDTPSPDLT